MKKKLVLFGLLPLVIAGCTEQRNILPSFNKKVALSSLEKTVIQQHYKDYEEFAMPAKGDIKIAVIPIWFTDSPYYHLNVTNKVKVKHRIDDAFFGTPEKTGWHSVKSYYEEESKGQFRLSGKTSQWYEYSGPSSDFYTKKESFLVTVTDWFFASNPEEIRTDYDADSDGYLDCVSFIYGAWNYQNCGREKDNMWAYKSSLSNPVKNVNNPGLNTYFWASFDFLLDDEELDQNVTYNGHFSAETFIHEFGHTFGLQDYYDYNSTYSPAGGFSMQDQNVGGHDPYSVMSIGWVDPYIPTKSMEIEIGAFQKTHDLVLLTPEWNEYDSSFDEYVLLELYTPTGLNEFHDSDPNVGERHYTYPSLNMTNKTGIRLWHVDARLTKRIDNFPYFPQWIYTTDLVTNVNDGDTVLAMSNTYYLEGGTENRRCSPLGANYYNYNILECIQSVGTVPESYYNSSMTQHLFDEHQGFTLSNRQDEYDEQTDTHSYYTRSTQFLNDGKLNSGKDLGWSFMVESITGEGDDAVATIRLIKE